jgi:hypothetical protein
MLELRRVWWMMALTASDCCVLSWVLEQEPSLVVTIAELVTGPVVSFSEVVEPEASDNLTLATTKERKDADAAFANVGEGPPGWCACSRLNGLGTVVK